MQKHYYDQCKVMIEAIQEEFSSTDCSFTAPMGGMYLFLTFPTLRMKSYELFETLAKQELLCISGDEFFLPSASTAIALEKENQQGEEATPPPQSVPRLRLTYAAAQPEQIRKGIKILSACVHEALEKQK
jgi:DNA-binding transcriptional MocR family regulator